MVQLWRKIWGCRRQTVPDSAAYWEQRAHRFGRRSVIDLRHREEAYDEVTRRQKALLYPLLRQELHGRESLLLDFGCGPGRFTADLAALIRGRAIGVDPVASLLEHAPRTPRVQYLLLRGGQPISLEDESVDVVWVALVLGGITHARELRQTASELQRVLRPGGLLFLVENTSTKPPSSYWQYRDVAFYRTLFPSVALGKRASYTDFDEEISIMTGRKHV